MAFGFADRCMMFFVQGLALASIGAAVIKWLLNGYSTGVMALLLTGGIVMTFIFVGYICNKDASPSPAQPSSTLPSVANDPPPKYRLTWRKEFLQATPDYLNADLERGFWLNRNDEGQNRVWRIQTPDTVVGVHGEISSPLDVDVHSNTSRNLRYPSGSASGISASLPVVPLRELVLYELDPDDGLPTYDEVLQRF